MEEPKWQLGKIRGDWNYSAIRNKLVWIKSKSPQIWNATDPMGNTNLGPRRMYINNVMESWSPDGLGGISINSVELLSVFASDVVLFRNYHAWLLADNEYIFVLGTIINDVKYSDLFHG